jgi:c-di-GMP-related signal transduction protein
MIFNLILAGVLIVSFLLIVWAYALGVRHGKAVRNDSVPQPVNPIKAVERIVEDAQIKQEQEKMQDDLDAVLNMSVDDMLKNCEQDRALKHAKGRG